MVWLIWRPRKSDLLLIAARAAALLSWKDQMVANAEGLHRSRMRLPNVGDVNYAARHQGTAEAFSQTVNSRPGLVGLRKIWTALGAG